MTVTATSIVAVRSRGLAAAAALAVLSACASKPDPTPAESAALCPPLKKEIADEEMQFHARSPLHKQIATDLAQKASTKMLNGERRLVQNGTSRDNTIDFVMAECIPLHGEATCKPVTLEYAAYQDRQFRRTIKQLQTLCVSRGHA